MQNIEQYQAIIEEGINALCFPDYPSELYEPVRYMMDLGGKRIRPLLTLLSCDLFGGDSRHAIRPALAMEVFHNFTLIHDDLMDNAPLRRGKVTVHERWNLSTAVLSGDVMLVLAYDLLSRNAGPQLGEAIALFNDTARKVCEGQQLDMVFEGREKVSIEEYVEMIGLKTAALLAGCLKMGALMAQAPPVQAELIYHFGYTLGTAFQIQDDLLDTYGSSSFGKTIGGDILENKKTYLALKAFELADAVTEKELTYLFGTTQLPAAEKISRVMNLYDNLRVQRHSEHARDRYYHKAMSDLEKISGNEESKQMLSDLAAMLINREK